MSCYLVRSPSAPRTEDTRDSGQIARELVARSASARAYGVATPRQPDVIDVDFEEVHEAPKLARGLPRGRTLRALPSGDQQS